MKCSSLPTIEENISARLAEIANGGPWFITGAPDSRWNDSHVNLLKHFQSSDFEAVRMGKIESRY